MTTPLVLRLDKKRAELLKQVARKRGATRGAVVRLALDRLLADEAPAPAETNGSNSTRTASNRKRVTAKKGVGWAEHFEWMKKHGRKIDWNDVLEFEKLENERGFR